MLTIRFDFTCYRHRFVIDKKWNSTCLPQVGHYIEMSGVLNSEELEKLRKTRFINEKDNEEFTLEDIMYNEEAFDVESISWAHIDLIRISLRFREDKEVSKDIRIIEKGENYITFLDTPAYSPVNISVFLSDISNLFNDKTLNFPWYAPFLPRAGDRFNAMSFLQSNEVEYINSSKVEDWTTEEGKIDFEEWSKSDWNKDKKLIDWMYERTSNTMIDEMSFDRNRGGWMNVTIWLVECD